MYVNFKIVFLLTISLNLFSPGNCKKSRIVGGTVADISYPFMVSIRFQRMHMCGGSIINERTVVTAAHCLANYIFTPARLSVHVGENSLAVVNGEVHGVIATHYHDLWNSTTLDYDVGLIRIADSFTFGPTVQAIKLADGNDIIEPGTEATVLGWGFTEPGIISTSEQLRIAQVPIVDQGTCNRQLPNRITDRMICAGYTNGGIDACQQDSGGPLFVNNILIGIISWGVGCAEPNLPGVYARVSALTPWIGNTLSIEYNEVL